MGVDEAGEVTCDWACAVVVEVLEGCCVAVVADVGGCPALLF